MQRIIDRKGEETMITMEEYLRRRNVIRGKEYEDADSGEDIHSKEKNEKRTEDSKKVNTVKWGAMMELAALLYV